LPDNQRTELGRGRLVAREPPDVLHGAYAARVVVAISNYLPGVIYAVADLLAA
jgi:hypothetical protein